MYSTRDRKVERSKTRVNSDHGLALTNGRWEGPIAVKSLTDGGITCGKSFVPVRILVSYNLYMYVFAYTQILRSMLLRFKQHNLAKDKLFGLVVRFTTVRA